MKRICRDFNLRVKLAVVNIKIGSAVMHIKTLVDAEFVSGCRFAGFRDVVLNWKFVNDDA